MYFYYEKKLTIAKKRILRTSNQFNNIRNEYRSALTKNQNINVQFLTPTVKRAITNNNVTVFLAPIIDSPKIRVLDIKMEVKILDKAEVLRDTWFYVALPIDSNINSRGWVKQSDFSLFYNNSRNITKSF